MVKVRFEKTGPAINESDIVAFEREIGYALPEDYRAFMLRHNGGVPHPDAIFVDALPDGVPAQILSFKSLIHDMGIMTIGSIYNDTSKRIAKHVLPIAPDTIGSLFLMSLDGADRGNIYYENCYYEEGDKEPTGPFDATYFVASSFSELLGNLFEYVDEQLEAKRLPWEKSIRAGDIGAVDEIIEQRLFDDLTNKQGRTPVEEAAIHNQPEMVRTLLDAGCEPRNAILFACRHGRESMVIDMIDRGIKPVDECLFAATSQGSITIVEKLLALGMSPNDANRHGMSALKIATHNRHQKMIDLLISAGATISVGPANSR